MDNYISSRGSTESPSEEARALIVQGLREAGLTHSDAPPLSRMTYRLYVRFDRAFSPPVRRYVVEWRGNTD